LLKLTEELGELTAEHLLMAGRSKAECRWFRRNARGAGERSRRSPRSVVLYLSANRIDVEAAIERKWLQHIDHYEKLAQNIGR
jgi:hypothetical protein